MLGKAEEVVISLLLNQKGIVEKRLKKPQPKKTPPLDSSQVNQLSPQSVQNFRFRSGMNE
jgi:hypothetical protein